MKGGKTKGKIEKQKRNRKKKTNIKKDVTGGGKNGSKVLKK